MRDKIFLDSNILIYAHSITEPIKKQAVEQIIDSDYEILLSTQVINEFINVMLKKKKFSLKDLAVTVKELEDNFPIVQISMETVQEALRISQRYQYSYFDSLMISAALEHNCSILYTEDMQNNHTIEGRLAIKNPFFEVAATASTTVFHHVSAQGP